MFNNIEPFTKLSPNIEVKIVDILGSCVTITHLAMCCAKDSEKLKKDIEDEAWVRIGVELGEWIRKNNNVAVIPKSESYWTTDPALLEDKFIVNIEIYQLKG